MSEKRKTTRAGRIVESAERVFGRKVDRISTPGGKNRASYRVHFSDRSVIATLRPNFRRTHLEAFTLKRLAPYCDDIPRCLGTDGEILFQSDVGSNRLNRAIADSAPRERIDLAAEAVASIFRIQNAGRRAGLRDILPHLGQNRGWIESLVDAATVLRRLSQGRSSAIDTDAVCDGLAVPATQFLKWDCRSGNAALDAEGRMRWFDFEYSGIRHGAEDLAWLIGDEAWPVPADRMQAIVIDAFDPGIGYGLDDYLDYLALYTTFHCLQRLQLVVGEADKRGWLSKRRIRKYDDVGAHPEFAAQLCRSGRFFAGRARLTAPIAKDLEEAEAVFLTLLREGLSRTKTEERLHTAC